MPSLQLQTTTTAQSTITVMAGLASHVQRVIDGKLYSSIHVVYDDEVAELAQKVASQLGTNYLVVIKSPELRKSFSGLEHIINELHQQRADRHSLVVNIGGGALCDIGGFAASVYMRGIPFINIPTTLLAQVDASIGGKTAINACDTKNLVGTFAQPLHVIVDPEVLRDLPDIHFSSGCAEMLKHGLIADENYWQMLSEHAPASLRSNTQELEKVIVRSCEIKHSIVSTDEHELADRKKLNFGHTVGHAVESLSHNTDKPYLHGEAVALGMIAESWLSNISDADRALISRTIQSYGLPIKLSPEYDIASIIKGIRGDKKNKAGHVMWTLLASIGTAVYDQSRTDAEVELAIRKLLP